ncbi:MAG TPA: hypothetical protein DER68_04265 [Ruminococcaceae bacterium]|nr:hypothetical protein [Oscillospiraceae bacterium]
MTEKNALGRVLVIMKEAYSAIREDALTLNVCALLDSLSAALSHAGNEKEPLSKLLGALKREIKAKNKFFYPKVRLFFKRVYAPPDFDYEKALKHVPAIIFGNDMICRKLMTGEADRAKSMCDAMKSYPGFLMGEFAALSDAQFYDLVFGYYPKLYDEPFMEKMKGLFD